MMVKACDTDGPLDLAAAKAAGYEAVGLHLHTLTPAAISHATALGLAVWSIGDTEGVDGRLEAIAVTDIALTIRQPAGTVIYLAPPAELANDLQVASTYFQAAADVLAARGFLGGFLGVPAIWGVIQRWGYRHYMSGLPDPVATIVTATAEQSVAGVGVFDCTIQADPGAWNYSGPVELIPAGPSLPDVSAPAPAMPAVVVKPEAPEAASLSCPHCGGALTITISA
jgi:hypothetical protein